MGSWAQPFYDALLDAYNKAVLRSLFIKGSPIVTAKGNYRYSEKDMSGSGSASVHVYENNVAALPPDLTARRVPLCFVTAMDKGEYELTLTLDTGEIYTFAKLGYDTEPFAAAVEKQIRALREKSLAAVKEIDPNLTAAQASQLAKLMPEGAAAPLGQIAAIAPSFAEALEEKLSSTRAAEYYTAFKDLCDPAQIYIGFRKNETGADSGGMAGGATAMLGGLTGGGNLPGAMGGMAGGLTSSENPPGALGGTTAMPGNLTGGGNPTEAMGGMAGGNASPIGNTEGAGTEKVSTDPYLLWLIAPSPDGKYAAVEFAQADSATFVYRTDGDFDSFARQLNRALEAICFKREVIRLSDDELKKPENADYFMATKRTASLQFVRANYAGRVIHASLEPWKRTLMEIWRGM